MSPSRSQRRTVFDSFLKEVAELTKETKVTFTKLKEAEEAATPPEGSMILISGELYQRWKGVWVKVTKPQSIADVIKVLQRE